MCTTNRYHPLVLDVTTGKQKVLFNIFYDMFQKEDYENLWYLGKELELARYGKSCISQYNHSVKREWQFVKWIMVPCGKCDECIRSRSRDWMIRMLCEAKKYSHNYFITLTYDDDHLPNAYNTKTGEFTGYTLVKDEISKFNKKLRTYLERDGLPSNFRFYAVGEYGTRTARPHYHVIYFNLELDDITLKYKNASHTAIYLESKKFEKWWSKGNVYIGAVTAESAAYCAGYCQKKLNRTRDAKKALIRDGKLPEFSLMSRRPGIGADYIDNKIEHINLGEDVDDKVYLPGGQVSSFPKVWNDKLKNVVTNDEWMSEFLEMKRKNYMARVGSDLHQCAMNGMTLDELQISRSNAKKKKKERM